MIIPESNMGHNKIVSTHYEKLNNFLLFNNCGVELNIVTR